MKKISSKTGDLVELKNTVSLLQNFTGFIKINDGMLFYRDSKLIFSIYHYEEADVRTILRNLPEIFSIEIYGCSDDELDELIQKELNKKHNDEVKKVITASSKKLTKNNIKNSSNDNSIVINGYSDLQKYLGTGIYIVHLKPKRYKTDEGVIVFKNGEEFSATYKSKNKNLEGKKALGKIKTIFAVSEVSAYIKKISINSFNKFLNDYPNSLLKSYISFDELIKKIKEKEFKLIKNDSLANVLTENPSLIEIDNSMYIVSNEKKPLYAFFEEYDGDKSYRHIKNFCIFNDIEFKIYLLNEEEFKLSKEFRENILRAL
jgi:hypothetical protein